MQLSFCPTQHQVSQLLVSHPVLQICKSPGLRRRYRSNQWCSAPFCRICLLASRVCQKVVHIWKWRNDNILKQTCNIHVYSRACIEFLLLAWIQIPKMGPYVAPLIDKKEVYFHSNFNSAVVDTTFVDIYVDTKNIPTCRCNIQHIDKRTMEK